MQITLTLTWLCFHNTKHLPGIFMAAKKCCYKDFYSHLHCNEYMSHDVQCTIYISTDSTSQQTVYSLVNESTLAFLDKPMIHLHVYPLNVYTCINTVHVIHIRKSKISNYKSRIQGHTFIDLGLNHFTWNGVIVFMPNMKFLCLVGQKLRPKRIFFYQSNWQIHRQIGKNLHVCLWQLSISWAYTANLCMNLLIQIWLNLLL